MLYTCTYDAPLGVLRLAATEDALTGLWLPAQKAPAGMENPHHPVLLKTKAWLDQYFSGLTPSVTALPLDPVGTPFQQNIFQILLTIPYGQVMTYGQIAKMLGKPMSAQAVGGAVKRNPISIIIPCHRVVGAKGLTGYQGGLDAKKWLLAHEKSTTM